MITDLLFSELLDVYEYETNIQRRFYIQEMMDSKAPGHLLIVVTRNDL